MFSIFPLIQNVLSAMYLKNEKYKHLDIMYELIDYIEFIKVM